MTLTFPYDDTVRTRTARLLYEALPLFYRVQDRAPRGAGELLAFLRVLAAPLSALRQSIDELHANLFIETCGDVALPLLAELVGAELVFPDAETNRRDVRGTVSRRQRKGTRPSLEELGRELTQQLAVLVEGWERLLVVQDLNLLRTQRSVADVRPLTFGVSAAGPLDTAHHLVDVRAIGDHSGRYHPRHLTHWLHVTQTFPVRQGTACYLSENADPEPLAPTSLRREWRYSFHALEAPWALRQRPVSADDRVSTDRIPAEHFAARPGDFFGRDGRFVVRIAGLPAAVAAALDEPREASDLLAHRALASGTASIELLERPSSGWENGRFRLSLCAVTLAGSVPDTETPASVDERASVSLGAAESVPGNTGSLASGAILLLRLQLLGGGSAAFFPGATVAVAGSSAEGCRAHPALAAQGYLRGALAVKLPTTWVRGTRWLYIAADGSTFDAQQLGTGAADVALLDGNTRLDRAFSRTVGPGAAWPPLARSSQRSRLTALPPAPGHGPQLLHGGLVLDAASDQPVSAGAQCALVFAARFFDAGVRRHELIGRLSWSGADPGAVGPSGARWELLSPTGAVLSDAAQVGARLLELARFRLGGPNQLVLAARFECSVAAVFTPAEVAWPADDDITRLIHLPELTALAGSPDEWADAHAFQSGIAQIADDGSTHDDSGLLRLAEGQVAPLRGPRLHVRRRVKWRRIPTGSFITDAAALRRAERCLDVDVDAGKFALYGEAPQAWPPGPLAATPAALPPPNVRVDFEDGYTGHVGARSAAREVLLLGLAPDRAAPARPTRLVTRDGAFHASLDPELYALPRHASLRAALDAISANAGDPARNRVEVIQIEDDATYPSESLSWPAGIRSLSIHAAESRRAVLRLLAAPPAPVSYEALSLRGLAWGGADVTLPTCERVDIEFCSVTDADSRLSIELAATGRCRITRSIMAGLVLTGGGVLDIRDSVVDSGKQLPATSAIVALEGHVELERTTVLGTTRVLTLEASECLFADSVTALDRFHGCIRFSAAPAGSVLPQRHEVTLGSEPGFASLDRHQPTHVRLPDHAPRELRAGGAAGGELGAFNHLRSTERLQALERRLRESTPAGLVWALLRVH